MASIIVPTLSAPVAPNVVDNQTVTEKVPNTVNTSTTTNHTPTTTSTTPALTSEDQTYITEGNNALTAALAGLTGESTDATQDYNQAEAELASELAGNQNTENSDLQSDTSNLATSEQQAREQGNSDYNSLLRALGALGAGGSTVATEFVPNLVQQSVENNIQGADQTKATDDRSAIQTYNQWLDGTYTPGEEQNKDTLNKALTGAQATYSIEKNELTAAINALKGNPSDPEAQGEDIQTVYSGIPNPLTITPTFTGSVAQYVAPTLSTYEMTPSQIAAAAGNIASAPTGTTIPILAVNGNQQPKQNQNGSTTTSTTPVLVPAS